MKARPKVIAGLAAQQAENTQQVGQEWVERAEQQARQTRPAERDGTGRPGAKAREASEGLTRAELGDQLAERGLPRTGNVDDLIDRLVEAVNR